MNPDISSDRASTEGSGVADAAPLREGVTVGKPLDELARYWVSWYQPGEDPRPLNFPPKDLRVLGWWCSGEGQSCTIICALVQASTLVGAKAAIAKDWPESVGAVWRFAERQPVDWVPNDRFAPEEWMLARWGAHIPQQAAPAAGITDERIAQLADENFSTPVRILDVLAFARAILAEASHKKE